MSDIENRSVFPPVSDSSREFLRPWVTPELTVLSIARDTLVSGIPNLGSDGILYS